jgi:hypothetical protein
VTGMTALLLAALRAGAPSPGEVQHFVFGLPPGSAQEVLRDGALIATPMASPGGVLLFTSQAGGSFLIRPADSRACVVRAKGRPRR